ncbi:MAG: beta-mannosidase [Bacteroidota bacterium]
MDKMHHDLKLDGPWTIESMEFEEGLARKAYEPGYKPKDPIPARVPCIVQAALLEAGRIEDPYWEMNNEKLLWIEEKEWWFFREFTVDEVRPGQVFDLVFDGIAYRADVWLNGISLGRIEGMFLRHELDVTRLIEPGRKNVLALRLRCLENSHEDRPGGRIKRGMVRSSGVVAPFSYWWNWSPHLVPIGLWKSVRLRATGGVALKDPCVRTAIDWDECEEAASADLHVTVEAHNRHGMPREAVIRGRITGEGFTGRPLFMAQRVTLAPGSNLVELVSLLERPRLWWPNGLGEHPLYRLKLEVIDGEGAVLDRTETTFGVRELRMLHNPDDLWVQEIHGQSNRLWSIVGNPYPWTFSINRRRVFIRGTNWLPTDSLFRFSEARYKLFLDQVETANLNLVRVWGGGIQETEAFYRLCDEKGIMTWTEFWLACASYPAMPHDLFLRCAEDQIRCVRNHPSVVLYCGGNEYNPDEPENKELVDKLSRVCAAHDPTRPFRRGSPYKGDRHGGLLMIPTRTSNKYNGDILNGDQRLVLFRAEVAVMRSAPLLESIRRFIGEDKIWPIEKQTWQYHHAVVGEQERDAREYGGADDLEHWLMAGQIAHGQNHRHNLEYCRQTKYWCSGCLQWQINGSWPAFHRELIDWYGVPKPAFYAYKRAAADYLVLADMEKYVFDGNEVFAPEIYVVSDKQNRTGEVHVRARIFDLNMGILYEQEGDAVLEADASAKAMRLAWRVPGAYLRRVFFLHLEMTRFGELLAENLYWVGTSAYARPEKVLNLNGCWQWQVGAEAKETGWKKTIMPSYWHKPPEAPPAGESVWYRRRVVIPFDWQGTELEVFCAGFEGNDEVSWNGVHIGSTEEELTVQIGTDDLLFTERWAERQAQEKGSAAQEPRARTAQVKGDRQNIRISSDPFIVPNLIKRFYRIPVESIVWGGENVLEIRLHGEHATGISEPVFVRAASSPEQQRAIIDYDNERAYLADLRNLPEVDLEAEVFHDGLETAAGGEILFHIRLRNRGSGMAFFTGLRLDGLDVTEAGIFYSDNYFAVLPGTEKTVLVKVVNDRGGQGKKAVRFEISGWNVKRKPIGPEIELVLG